MAAPMVEEEVVDIFATTDTDILEGLVYADDRLKFLDENFSKSEEAYWYYRLLTLQKHFGSSLVPNAKNLASSLEKVMKVEGMKDSPNIRDVLLRQDVINFEKATNPVKRQTLGKLKSLIGANLNVMQEASGPGNAKRSRPQSYPSNLNLDTKQLLNKTWNQFNLDKRNDVRNVFTPTSASFLSSQKLNADQCAEFLDLIENESPEIPYLLTYVGKDIKENKTDFGDRMIHFRLTKEDLDMLAKTPQCKNSENYMRCYAWKLRKVTDVSYRYDIKARSVYLDDLKKFADDTLAKSPKFNSLRALILFNWLCFQEEKGVYDKRAIKTYMKIPKLSEYCTEIYANANPAHVAQLDYDVDLISELDPIVDDVPYVRRALRHIFQNFDDNTSKWKDVVDTQYLRKLYCECKLMKGQGRTADLRRAYGKFGKYAYQELCQEVNLELLRNNKVYHGVEDAVSLTLLLKNVPELEVRIYQIDCKEYFLRFNDRVKLDIPLEGLAPNYVITRTYEDSPLMQRQRKIELPQLKGARGVFLIEFFGNGHKTRAMIRKGELRYISQQEFKSANDEGLGCIFRVFDEENHPVTQPEVWLKGNRYTARDETGVVFVPFAEEDYEKCPMILEDTQNPGSATIHFFDYKTENYRLECGMFMDRESLLEKQQAKVIIRPTLLLNETPVSVENLKNVQLIIETTDAGGFSMKRVIALQLADTGETIQTFVVPNELRTVSLTLSCEVFSLSQEKDLQLTNEESFRINDIDKTNALADMHLIPKGSLGYVLAVLGKNGEPYSDVVVDVELTQSYFCEPLKYSLQTDANGNIVLGRLPDVTTLEAVARSPLVYQEVDEETKHTWILCTDQVNVPTIVNIAKGQTVRIPFMAGTDSPPKVDVYDIDFVKKFKTTTFKNGYIEIKGLPGGIFQAFVRDTQTADILIHVSKGDTFDNHVVSKNRIIELSEERPLQITEVKGTRQEGFRVSLQGTNEGTRVHIFSTHLVPRFSCYSFLASPEIPPSVIDYQAYPGLYGEIETVSKEFQYIASRKNATKFSGNLLERPSLLNKRWTTAGPVKQRRPPMAEYKDEVEFVEAMVERIKKKATYDPTLQKIQFDSSNLEFLSQASSVACNLPVDRNGSVTIEPDLISPFHNILQIVAVDDDNTCLRNVILQDNDGESYRDVRLTNVLDPEVHWTERREILELREPGEVLFVENFATSEIETYDDLSDVFELFTTLSGVDELQNFKFLTRWNELTLEQKLMCYDEYVCNELNFYVYRKDVEFFSEVVQPLLASKVQKSFMDKYLLDMDLADYTSVVKYTSLNTLERILLASKIAELAEPTLKYLLDSISGLPELPQESDSLFQAALESKQLSADATDLLGKKYTVVAPSFEKTGTIIDQTREYQETRYYHVSFEDQTSQLVTPSRFWYDYATFLLGDEGEFFLSRNFHTPTKNLTQMLVALATTDLPFRSEVAQPTLDYIDGSTGVNMTVHTPTIVLSRQIKQSVVQTSALAVSTNYFDPEDPFEVVDFERQDKFLQMPLLTQKVYGCRVVITNVSSMTHTVELLSQIPEGSIPVYDGFRTKNSVQELAPYTTKHREFYFYFPFAGEFTHYQTRVSKNGKVIGFGRESPHIQVVDPEDVVDTTSWDYFSNRAEKEELLEYLSTSKDVHSVDLSKIAWRMADEHLFTAVTTILRDRQIWNESIWAYSLKHYSIPEVKEYLSMQPKFLELIAPDLSSSALTDYDAFTRQTFQIMEYWPLTSPRVHYNELKNEYFQKQYLEFLKRSFYASYNVESLSAVDKMTGVYYFLIQNRVDEGLTLFEKIDEEGACTVSKFTYDYLRAYLAFYSADVQEITNAQGLCDEYLAQTLPPSKNAMWSGISEYLEELKSPAYADNLFDPTTEADILSAKSKKLDCDVNSDRTITISYKNVSSVEINFYQTDIELQFSTAPFRQEHNAFNFVAPTDIMNVDLDPTQRSETINLPASLHDKSSVVEVIGGGMTISRANYDNHLRIEISEQLRQIRVFNRTSNQAISKAYVKVYCKTPDAPDGRFLKDGYTDLRGRFDYVSVSSDELKFVEGLAILVLSEGAGADVLEVGI